MTPPLVAGMGAALALAVFALLLHHLAQREHRTYRRMCGLTLDLTPAAARGQLHLNDHRPGGDAADSPVVREAPTPHKERT